MLGPIGERGVPKTFIEKKRLLLLYFLRCNQLISKMIINKQFKNMRNNMILSSFSRLFEDPQDFLKILKVLQRFPRFSEVSQYSQTLAEDS